MRATPEPRRGAPQSRRPGTGALAVLAALVLVVACGAPGTPAPSSPAATTAPSGGPTGTLPVPPEAVPGGPAIPLAELSPAVAAPYAGVARVDIDSACSGVLIAPREGAAPASAPAYMLTSGHCERFMEPNVVVRDGERPGPVAFGWPGGPVGVAEVHGIPWATMKGTDLAILELDKTLVELTAAGIVAFPIAGAMPPVATPVVVVGAPTTTDGADRQLLLAACVLGEAVDLVERWWSWESFVGVDCADIRPGSSGSPVLDPATGQLVAVVNTTTSGSAGVADCAIGRPCEVDTDGVVVREDAPYAAPVAGLGACFDDLWRFALDGAGCALDPGYGIDAFSPNVAVNPVDVSATGAPPISTWSVVLQPSEPGVAFVATKTGMNGDVDCRDPDGYGTPVPAPADGRFDEPLPTAEGLARLCVLGGPRPIIDEEWQAPQLASIVTVRIDRTPPGIPVEATVTEDATAWFVDPFFAPPEISGVLYKTGPIATMDCLDRAGYGDFLLSPIPVPKEGGPVRFCLLAFDDAGNAAPPWERNLGS